MEVTESMCKGMRRSGDLGNKLGITFMICFGSAYCDSSLKIGTSSVVYPAAMFAPELARREVPVAEFNIEATPETGSFQ